MTNAIKLPTKALVLIHRYDAGKHSGDLYTACELNFAPYYEGSEESDWESVDVFGPADRNECVQYIAGRLEDELRLLDFDGVEGDEDNPEAVARYDDLRRYISSCIIPIEWQHDWNTNLPMHNRVKVAL